MLLAKWLDTYGHPMNTSYASFVHTALFHWTVPLTKNPCVQKGYFSLATH